MANNRVLHNTQVGGFSLSEAASERLGDARQGRQRHRHDPAMLAVVDELGLENSGRRGTCTLEVKQLEGEWYDIVEHAGAEEVRDRIWQKVHRTSDMSDTLYILDVGFQELYDAGFITENQVKTAPKSAAESP